MAGGRVIGPLTVERDGGFATGARDPQDHMPVPTLDERANLYLRAVYGDRDFSNEDYSRARNLLLGEMAADVAAKLSARPPDSAPDDQAVDRAIEDPPEANSPPAPQSLRFRLPRTLSVAACATAIAAVVAVLWLGGMLPTAWFAPKAPSHDSRTAVQTPPSESASQTMPSIDSRIAAAERELASVLNAAQLDNDEVAALIKRGQELIADGKYRLARLVLEQAADAGSGPAAL